MQVPGSVHRWWRCRNTSTGRPLIDKVIIKETRQSPRFYPRRSTMLQFSCHFIHKTEQDMLTTHALAHMSNAWVLFFHPGIDHSFKCRHTISAHGTIEALVPIHCPILSAKKCNCTVVWPRIP